MKKNNCNGLLTKDIKALRQQYGLNRLPEPPLPGIITLFFHQFLSPFIYILIIASTISFLLGQTSSGVFILVVLLINALIGTIQEYSAQKSAAALRKIVKGTTHVIRDGLAQTIDFEELLPGDLVLLSSGDKIPADLKLISTQNLAVDESMLTGESLATTKCVDTHISDTAPLSDRVNCCFAGTIITRGRAQGIVTHTGLNTQIGKIANRVTRDRESEAPLMIRIKRFTYQVATGIMLAIIILLAMMALRGGYQLETMLLMIIGLAVSTIPEGLPAALTVALAIGMRRMAKHNVIIRKLIAVEALGSCTFICSDKTGTLTVNELTIQKVVLPDEKSFEVTGEGVKSGGSINGNHDKSYLKDLCTTGVLANESHLDYAGGEWVSDGDIVDVAFLVFAKKLGLSLKKLREEQCQIDLIPYESEKAFSGSLNQSGNQHYLHVKGSPERMLEMCTHMWTEQGAKTIDKVLIQNQFESLAKKGYRVIALARREASQKKAESQLEAMVFLGMVAMIDPVRPEAYNAVKRCKEGGIEVAMVTGDHPETAKAIAIELGICDGTAKVVTGTMLNTASSQSPESLTELIREARVFARIEPQQKEIIVKHFIKLGHFVAVTGDGVNDAPAMRAANAGIAMGKRGTDVAKETADLIITDDNFSSIVNGIEQGRIVYNNIRKVIALLIATGFSAILLFFLTVIAGLPMPLLAVQLLWLNLVANGLQDIALAFEPKEGNELNSPPRNPREPIFERRIIEHVLVTGSLMGSLAFVSFWWFYTNGNNLEEARNLTLMLLVLFGNIHALNSRSETRSLFQIPFLSNPFIIIAVPVAQIVHICAMCLPIISDVLELRPISVWQWLGLFAISLSLFLVEELHKLYHRKKPHRPRLDKCQSSLTS